MYGEQLPSNEIPFDRIITHIMETIKETKRISANLRPTTLDDLGLIATAQWFCRNLAGLYQGIRITPEIVHTALRQMAGIEQHAFVEKFPLNMPDSQRLTSLWKAGQT